MSDTSMVRGVVLGALLGAGATACLFLLTREAPPRPASEPGGSRVEAARDRPRAPDAPAPAAQPGGGPLESENASLRTELSTLQARVAELENRLAQAARHAASVPAPPAPSSVTPPAPPGNESLRVRFGESKDQEDLKKTDWREAATAVRAMLEPIKELKAKVSAGQEVPRELGIQIAKENAKLQKIAFAVNGKLKTWLTGNGEYTHPLVIANLIAKHLELAERPLDEGQVRAIERLGEEYEQAVRAREATYGERTPLLEKVMDELEQKLLVRDRIEAVLTPAQREVVVAPPETRDVSGLDLYSPVLLLSGHAFPLAKASAAELEPALVALWTSRWKVAKESAPALEAAAATWRRTVEPGLAPVAATEAAWFRAGDALAAGRATVVAMKELLRTLPPSDATTKAILAESAVSVPRLVVVPKTQ